MTLRTLGLQVWPFGRSISEYGTLDLAALQHHFQELSFLPFSETCLWQVKTDMATVESEGDPAEHLLPTRGF